jgi:class 3 adenylate cyclase
MNARRKLAAILVADVAGYSRLTGINEEGTLTRLRKLRRELINALRGQGRSRETSAISASAMTQRARATASFGRQGARRARERPAAVINEVHWNPATLVTPTSDTSALS